MVAKVRQLPDQAGDVPYTCASVEKARSFLGYEATVSFDEGIRRTVEWYNARNSAAVSTVGSMKVQVSKPLASSIRTSLFELTRKTSRPIHTAEDVDASTTKCGLSRCVSNDAIGAAKRMKISP
jgi:hypothetical protein